jgi:hypothetical protein
MKNHLTKNMRCILGYISASIPQNLQTRAVCRYIQINLWKKIGAREELWYIQADKMLAGCC